MPDPLDPGIESGAFADAAAILASTFPATGTISRKTVASDGAGGMTETWAAVASPACNLNRFLSGEEAARGGELQAITTWRCAFPVGTDVRPQDRVTIVDRGVTSVAGRVYEVIDTDAGRANPLAVTAVLARFSEV
jgi:head-tail adaptor